MRAWDEERFVTKPDHKLYWDGLDPFSDDESEEHRKLKETFSVYLMAYLLKAVIEENDSTTVKDISKLEDIFGVEKGFVKKCLYRNGYKELMADKEQELYNRQHRIRDRRLIARYKVNLVRIGKALTDAFFAPVYVKDIYTDKDGLDKTSKHIRTLKISQVRNGIDYLRKNIKVDDSGNLRFLLKVCREYAKMF